MPLLTLWASSPDAINQFTIEQVVGAAGDGVLKDNSLCSMELRAYLSEVPSEKLAVYIDRCVTASFPRGGLVLQDLVNELGRRLDYTVTHGRYRGTPNAIGFDGKWVAFEGHSIIIEVKTTDTYRISLDTIATYRDKLRTAGELRGSTSILIVVGREDTGEFEAQVRGSRHAWDIRLISADALIKLVQLKEAADGPETERKIRSILAPMEYTRLDSMIDVMFTTVRDTAEPPAEAPVAEEQVGGHDEDEAVAPQGDAPTQRSADSQLKQRVREQLIAAIEKVCGVAFVKKSTVLYWNAGHDRRIACTVSRRYEGQGPSGYWFGYDRRWDEFLREGSEALIALGCVESPFGFAVPWRVTHPLLERLTTTTRPDGTYYWHIRLVETSVRRYEMLVPRSKSVQLDSFRIDFAQ